MTRFSKFILISFFAALFAGVGSCLTTTAFAADTAQEANTGLKELPPGAIPIDGQFEAVSSRMPDKSGNGNVSIDNNTSPATGNPYSQINIKGTYAKLAVTSTDAYRLDFNHPFKGRVFMKTSGPQDGLSFFIHNDPRKTKAQTESNEGQTMGVFGDKQGYSKGSPAYTPEQKAIKNAFAVEFDSYSNASPTSGNNASAFDYVPASDPSRAVLQNPHMAWAYPGNPASYRPVNDSGSWLSDWSQSSGWFGTKSAAATLVHQNLQPLVNTPVTTSISDGTWYEFRFESDGTTFSYYLRNPRTGIESSHVSLPIKGAFSNELKLSENGNKAYWGFAAATGANAGNASFVFTQTPTNVSGDVAQKVSQEGKVISASSPSEATQALTPGKKALFQSTFTQTQGGDGAALPVNSWQFSFDKTTVPQPGKMFTQWKDGQTLPIKIVNKKGETLQTVEGTINGNNLSVKSLTGLSTLLNDQLTFQFELTASKEQYSISPNKTVASMLSAVNVGTSLNQASVNSEVNYFAVDPELAPTVAFTDSKDTEKTVRAGEAFDVSIQDENQPQGDQITLYYQKKGTSAATQLAKTNGQYVLPEKAAGDYELFAKDARGERSNGLIIHQTVDQPTVLGWDNALSQQQKDAGVHAIDQALPGTFYWKDADQGDKISFWLLPENVTPTKDAAVATIAASTADNTVQKAAFTIPASALHYQEQNFQIVAVKDDQVVSQKPLLLTVTNQGSVSLVSVETGGSDKDLLSFEGTRHPGAYTYTRKTGNTLTIKVKDTREGSPAWSIGATASKENTSPFDLLWRPAGSTADQPLSDSALSVITSTSSDIKKVGSQYTATWDEQHGVLARANQTAALGTYQTKQQKLQQVTWNLYDTPDAQ